MLQAMDQGRRRTAMQGYVRSGNAMLDGDRERRCATSTTARASAENRATALEVK
jgi:hypothetical protein